MLGKVKVAVLPPEKKPLCLNLGTPSQSWLSRLRWLQHHFNSPSIPVSPQQHILSFIPSGSLSFPQSLTGYPTSVVIWKITHI